MVVAAFAVPLRTVPATTVSAATAETQPATAAVRLVSRDIGEPFRSGGTNDGTAGRDQAGQTTRESGRLVVVRRRKSAAGRTPWFFSGVATSRATSIAPWALKWVSSCTPLG